MQKLNDTAHLILDHAEEFVQTKGFNAFSYRDIALRIGIKTSSIHYYFPSKNDLAISLIDRYIERYEAYLKLLNDKKYSPEQRLRLLAERFHNVTKDNRKFCLCMMMTADFFTLPKKAQKKLSAFFRDNLKWIAKQVDLMIPSSKESRRKSMLFQAALEGGMLIARCLNSKKEDYFSTLIDIIIQETRP